jgi:Helix-turn-helix domain
LTSPVAAHEMAHTDSGHSHTGSDREKGDSMPKGIFLPQRFRDWRNAQPRRLLQSDMALRLHCSRSLISRIEKGLTVPTERFLDLLGRIYKRRLPPGGVGAFFRRPA